MVPQGDGDVALGHRCPGEGLTLTMLEVAVRALAGVNFTVPAQDLGYDQSRIPTRPRSVVLLQPVPAAEQQVQAAGQPHDQWW